MKIPFKIKLLTKTAKTPTQENVGDLWDIYADSFDYSNLQDVTIEEDYRATIYFNMRNKIINHVFKGGINVTNKSKKVKKDEIVLYPQGRILVKTGIAIELPINYGVVPNPWYFENEWKQFGASNSVDAYAVADIRPRSGLALKRGITVLNTPGTIDNSYRKEIGVVLYNAGHEPYTIKRGDKIAQMLIRPLYPSQFEIVEEIKSTKRGGYGSTGNQ